MQYQVGQQIKIKRPGSGRGRPQMASVVRRAGLFLEVQYRRGETGRVQNSWIVGPYVKKYDRRVEEV